MVASESKLDKIESAIIRLTEISSDLKSMIAVNDTRISQQEKISQELHLVLETRRVESDAKLKDVYDTIRSTDAKILQEDSKILAEIKAIREEHNAHYNCLNEKISSIQKYVWIAIGGVSMFTWLFFYIGNYFLKYIH
jgi:chromosome segregation ATPase